MTKKLVSILLSVALTLSIFIGAAIPASASNDQVKPLVKDLIGYYRDGVSKDMDVTTDLQRTLEKLKAVSPDDYTQWVSILKYWDWVENEMPLNIGVAPDGLPDDNTHAFIVLGFALNTDGTMKPELVGRLETALASAKKYPNSYILVTGGVKKNGWTEGDRMHDWLIENGLPESRIIVENQSSNTAQNASNSFEILYNQYDIKSVSIISSEYHLRRGTILYYAESLIKARELGKTPIQINGNAGWLREDLRSESITQKASSLAQIAGVGIPSYGLKISELQSIAVTGQSAYTVGDELDLTVTAAYNINAYTRDVTDSAVITGYDPAKAGPQTIEVSYTENGVTKNATFEIEVQEPPTDKTELEKLITEAMGVDQKLYTAESWSNMLEKRADAIRTFADESAKQEAIDAAADALRKALDALEEKPQAPVKTELRSLIDKYSKLNLRDYKPDGVKAFKEALANAKTVYRDPDATQDAIQKAIDALQAAKDNLVLKDGQNGTKPPATGDAANLAGLSGLLLLSAAGLVVLGKKRR